MSFTELLKRIENGDSDASTELLDQYGHHIRRIARIRLNDTMLRRVEDSMDIYQSVMANFSLRAAGQLTLILANAGSNLNDDKKPCYG